MPTTVRTCRRTTMMMTIPTTFTKTTTSVTTVVTQRPIPSNPLLYATFITSLIVIPLVLICICCYKRVSDP